MNHPPVSPSTSPLSRSVADTLVCLFILPCLQHIHGILHLLDTLEQPYTVKKRWTVDTDSISFYPRAKKTHNTHALRQFPTNVTHTAALFSHPILLKNKHTHTFFKISITAERPRRINNKSDQQYNYSVLVKSLSDLREKKPVKLNQITTKNFTQ